MAELLEHGIRSTLVLPAHRPSLLETPITMPSQQSDAVTSLGLNPAQALQHPAFYYYASARYTEKRREMFAAALELEVSGHNRRCPPGTDRVSRPVVPAPSSLPDLPMRRKSIISLSSLRLIFILNKCIRRADSCRCIPGVTSSSSNESRTTHHTIIKAD